MNADLQCCYCNNPIDMNACDATPAFWIGQQEIQKPAHHACLMERGAQFDAEDNGSFVLPETVEFPS